MSLTALPAEQQAIEAEIAIPEEQPIHRSSFRTISIVIALYVRLPHQSLSPSINSLPKTGKPFSCLT
jgi:hypothetical protein